MPAFSSFALGAMVLIAAGGATAQNVASNKAAGAARNDQRLQLEAAEIAANKSTAATTKNTGDISLESEESLADAAIRNKSTKNRLRVDRTGLSLGSPSTKSASGLSI